MGFSQSSAVCRVAHAMPSAPLSSAAFANSVLRLARYRDRPVVVKLGGSAMEDPAATHACLQSVVVLGTLGIPIILVHGGGKPIDRAMAAAGLTPKKVAGRRYTDDATLEIVVRVLGEEINLGLVGAIRDMLGQAHRESDAIFGDRLTLPDTDGCPIDLGRVGSVTRIDDSRLLNSLGSGSIPVIPSLAHATDGSWLNINADTAASAVAGALNARYAIFLTDTPGVLRDRTDPTSLLSSLSREECRGLISSGVIDGGMVPKIEACFEALDAGAEAALILDGRIPYSLLDVFLKDTFAGTTITR